MTDRPAFVISLYLWVGAVCYLWYTNKFPPEIILAVLAIFLVYLLFEVSD